MDLPVNYDQLKQSQRKKVRLEYIKLQEGLCYCCKEPLEGDPSIEVRNSWINRDMFPIGFFKYPVHLHHCHTTGNTIGAVHARCNAYLWQYKGE